MATGYQRLDDAIDGGLSLLGSLLKPLSEFYQNHKMGVARALWFTGAALMLLGFACALAPISPMLIGPGIALSILESVASLSTFMFASVVGGIFASSFAMMIGSSTIYAAAQQEEALEKSECDKLDTRFTGKENLILQGKREQKKLQKKYDKIAEATGAKEAKQAGLREPSQEEIDAADARLAKLEEQRQARAAAYN